MANLPDVYLPAIWFEAHVKLPEKESEMLAGIASLPSIMNIVSIVGIVVFSTVTLLSMYYILKIHTDKSPIGLDFGKSQILRPMLKQTRVDKGKEQSPMVNATTTILP